MKPSVEEMFYIYAENKFRKKSKSLQNYLTEIRLFEDFCGSMFEDATRQQVQAYVGYINDRYSATTIEKKLHILSAFANYLYDRGMIPGNFFRYAGPISSPRNISDADTISPEQFDSAVTALLHSALDNVLPVAAAIQIAYYTACGQEELVALQIDRDVLYSNERFGLVFHNFPPLQMARTVPLPQSMTGFMESYIKTIPASCPSLFYNTRGKPMSSWTLWHTLQKAACPYTFQDIHRASLIRLLQTKISEQEAAAFNGQSGRWLYRYRICSRLPDSPFD